MDATENTTASPAPTRSASELTPPPIPSGVWKNITKANSPSLFRKLGAERVEDANELAPWAIRASMHGHCVNIKAVRIAPEASRKQLSWTIKCDQTMQVAISEKSALEERHRFDPSRYPDDGSGLADMYRRDNPADDEGIGKMAATIINLNGHLCARVTNIARLQMRDGVYEVTCVEYRGGTGTVRYLLNTREGIASRL